MRGFAALLVLGYHLWTEFGVFAMFERAYLAVDFFFMLSGFVMARTYEDSLRQKRIGAGAFLTARYRRLWAPLAAGTLIGWLYHVASSDTPSLAVFLAGMTLIPHLGLEKPYILNRPAWSIFFELVANAVHALVISRVGVRLVAAIALLSAIFLAAYAMRAGSIAVGFRSSDFFSGIPRVLMGYCLGVILWRFRKRPPCPPGVATLLLVAALLCIPQGLGWDMGFVLLLCPMLILFGAQPFGGQVAATLGALSFPLYAVHFPVLQLSQHFAAGPIVGAAGAIAAAIVVGLVADWRLARSVWRPAPVRKLSAGADGGT